MLLKIFRVFLYVLLLMNFLVPPCVEWTEHNGRVLFEQRFIGYKLPKFYRTQMAQTMIAWDGVGTGGHDVAEQYTRVHFWILGIQSGILLALIFITTRWIQKRRKHRLT